jgi:iron complex outermembrane recepter protein
MTTNWFVKIGRNIITPLWLFAVGVPTTFADPALDTTSSFTIRPQPLPSALMRYSEQSGVQVTSAGNLVEDKQSRGVIGKLDASTALRMLLEGTALSFEVVDDSSVIIVPVRTWLDPGPGERRALGASAKKPISSQDDEVIVTGSHIRSTTSKAPSVYSFDRSDIAMSGATSVQEFMRGSSLNFSGGRTEATGALMSFHNGGRDNINLGSGINIHGLGNEATLVLINGRRIAGGGFGAYQDVSAVPLSAIERIDVLPDGASAIYGSDAIAGVVNIVLRDSIDGAETSLRYGGVTSGSLRDWAVNQLMGWTFDDGSSLFANVDYGDRGELPATERSYASGLWDGHNDLLPAEERFSALVRGEYIITDSLRAVFDAHLNRRDSRVHHFQSRTRNQLGVDAESELLGGTAEISSTFGTDWELSIAHTYSSAQNSRANHLGIIQSADSTVFVDLTASTTEARASGTVLQTSGGSVQLAVGAERREESMDIARRNVIGSPDSDNSIHRDVNAAYAEVRVPLFAESSADRRAHRLDISAAVRYEDYTDVGATDTAKFAAIWSPLPNLNLQGSWGTSLRAPYLQQYDGDYGAGIIVSAPNPSSPTGTTLLAIAAQAPHPDLGAEHATTWTAGFSFGREAPERLQLAATYFDIDYRDRIITPAISATPFGDDTQMPLIFVPADPEVLEFVRNAPLHGNLTGRSIDEVEATLDGRTRNQSRARVSGLDLSVSKLFRLGSGAIRAGVSATYFLAFDTAVNRETAWTNILDTAFNPIDLRARGELTWSNQQWSLSGALNYTDDYTDNQLSQLRNVSSWTTIDLSASYTFPHISGLLRDLNIRTSITNAADRAPPRLIDRSGAYGNAGFDVENANALGRFVSVQLTKAW